VTHIETKLYIVEGPPCTGKSDTARYVSDILADGGRQVSLYDENTMDHPADYTFHAYMTEAQIGALTPEERRQVYSESVKTGAGYVVPLTRISVSLFGKVVPYKIYDGLDWETERSVMLEYWRSFAEMARMNESVNVFVGSLLKNPVCETMIRLELPASEFSAYIREINLLIAPLNPAVIYLKGADIAMRVNEGSADRQALWLRSAISYHDAQSYARRRGLTGFDGYVACLQARQQAELDILDSLPVKKLILTDAHQDWDGAYDAITAFVTGKTLQKR
jgi:hypothetical protein